MPNHRKLREEQEGPCSWVQRLVRRWRWARRKRDIVQTCGCVTYCPKCHGRWPTTLECCPPGLFLFNGDFGFKTEYSDPNGPEAYCVGSGEYFWGGTNGDAHARRMLMVTPVIITPNATGSPTPNTGGPNE